MKSAEENTNAVYTESSWEKLKVEALSSSHKTGVLSISFVSRWEF
jgi:hypothetical protein